jgi:hypothetical protein
MGSGGILMGKTAPKSARNRLRRMRVDERSRIVQESQAADADTPRELTERRGEAYGPAEDNHQATADFFVVWLRRKYGVELRLDAEDVVTFNICQKLSRGAHRRKPDNWHDVQGYAQNALDMPGGGRLDEEGFVPVDVPLTDVERFELKHPELLAEAERELEQVRDMALGRGRWLTDEEWDRVGRTLAGAGICDQCFLPFGAQHECVEVPRHFRLLPPHIQDIGAENAARGSAAEARLRELGEEVPSPSMPLVDREAELAAFRMEPDPAISRRLRAIAGSRPGTKPGAPIVSDEAGELAPRPPAGGPRL